MITLAQLMGPNMQRQKLLAMQTILNLLRTGDGMPPLRGLDAETPIQFRHAAVVWCVAHIAQRGIIPQEALMSIVQMFPTELIAIGQTFEDAGIMDTSGEIADLPARILGIADRRFMSLTGLQGCFDLKECRVLTESPLTFEGVSYNLAAPVLVECIRIHKEAKDGPQPQNAGRTFRSNDALNRAFGAGRGPVGSGSPPVGPQHRPDGAGADKRRRPDSAD